MGSIHTLRVDTLSRTLRRFVLADELVPITIRFLAHADEEDLEFCRWSVQGSIQRRNGIRAAKGFTLDFAKSGRPFRLYMEPPEARIFTRQVSHLQNHADGV